MSEGAAVDNNFPDDFGVEDIGSTLCFVEKNLLREGFESERATSALENIATLLQTLDRFGYVSAQQQAVALVRGFAEKNTDALKARGISVPNL